MLVVRLVDLQEIKVEEEMHDTFLDSAGEIEILAEVLRQLLLDLQELCSSRCLLLEMQV